MHTVCLKISAAGHLLLAHPGAKAGPDRMIYAIADVPDNVLPASVAQHVSKLIILHPHDDPKAWAYKWPDLADKAHGCVINGYRRDA